MRIKNEDGIIIGDGVRADIAEMVGLTTEDNRVIELIRKIESLCFVYYREGWNDCEEENNLTRRKGEI